MLPVYKLWAEAVVTKAPVPVLIIEEIAKAVPLDVELLAGVVAIV